MTTNWLLIENKGEIDLNALILMGGSTKREDDTKVGFFGSGNKYAIALMLRKDIKFRMFSGNNEIIITTKHVPFRDKSFQQILINGQETSLTTDMGPQWDSWMGIREWVSNSIDEGHSNIVTDTSNIIPKAGYTRIYVEHHPDTKEIINNWNNYFSFDRTDVLVQVGDNRVYPQTDAENESLLLYRKGIQCYYIPKTRSLYTYDLSEFPINESRVLSDTWGARNLICRFLINNVTVAMAQNILSNAIVKKYYEATLDYDLWGRASLCKNWREAIGNYIVVNNEVSGFYAEEIANNKHYRVPMELAKAIKSSFPDVVVYGVGQDGDSRVNWKKVTSTPKMIHLVKKAKEFFNEINYAINYEIETVEFDKEDILGCAYNNTIYVAAKVFDMGMKEVVMTIIEESEHLKTKLKDETREWATHWIRMYVTAEENAHGYFL